jgi:hypothetical protein
MLRLIHKFFAGDVPRTTLLTRLLPLSFASFFGTLLLGILLFPGSFDWQKRVISHVLAPRYNPDAYWFPSLGLMAAALLTLPFAGYVEQRLRASTPRLARLAGVAFTLGFLLVASVAVPLPGWRRLHEFLARASVVPFALGVLCCRRVCAQRPSPPSRGPVLAVRPAGAFLDVPPVAAHRLRGRQRSPPAGSQGGSRLGHAGSRDSSPHPVLAACVLGMGGRAGAGHVPFSFRAMAARAGRISRAVVRAGAHHS